MIITILNYETGEVYQLTNLPNQLFINDNYNGDWEDWLCEGQNDVNYNSSCYYMLHNLKEIDVVHCATGHIAKRK